jgi:hypothetical protein
MNDKTTNREPGMRAIDEMAMHPEQDLRRMLVDLHREYQMRAAPIIKALADYEALRVRPSFIVPMLPDDHPLIASMREAAERAMCEGTGAYRVVVNPAMPEGEMLVVGANVVRVTNIDDAGRAAIQSVVDKNEERRG